MPSARTRPETTLFLSVSVDGRITSHDSDPYDRNKIWKKQPGIRSILQRFYEFSDRTTSSLTTGLVMKKAGVNIRSLVKGKVKRSRRQMKTPLVVFDEAKDLTPHGVLYLAQNVRKVCIVGYQSIYKQIRRKPKNLVWVPYTKRTPLEKVMQTLWGHGIKRIVIHSAGPLNARWISAGLVDHLTVIVAPLLVGKNGTSMLMDTVPFKVRPVRLVEMRTISDDSYLFLRYDILNVVPGEGFEPS